MHQLAEWNAVSDRAERPPAGVVRAAKAAFARRVPASDVAPLLWDSDTGVADGDPAGLARGAPDPADDVGPYVRPRRLLFAMDGLGVELLIEPSAAGDGPEPGTRCVWGRLLPAIRASVSLVRDTGDPLPVTVDDAGCFTVDDVAPGLLRLRAARPGRRCLHTAWILVD